MSEHKGTVCFRLKFPVQKMLLNARWYLYATYNILVHEQETNLNLIKTSKVVAFYCLHVV